MKRFKLIIFDLDGTLIDAYAAITRSFNFAMKRFGYPRQSRIVIRRAVGWGDTHLLRSFVKARDVPGVLETYRRDHKTSLVKYSKVFPGVIRLLAGFKAKGYKLAVASNRPTRFSLILIRHLRLRPYFDYVLCADKLKEGKPHPEILRKIMAKFSLSSADTLYVGDMVIDAQAGRRAKVKTVIVTTGSSSACEIKAEKPWKVIKKIKILPKLINP
jgi:phosphoglycolate phosphatase